MIWEKIDGTERCATVVRALSFSKRTEDGCVVAGESRRNQIQSQTSFTSFDVKKSRRNARLPMPKTTVTMPKSAARRLESVTTSLSTQSLERPSRINKLVLRVPSDASEYKHCRVIHSTCVPQSEGDDAQRLCSPQCISPSVSVVSQACQTNVPFNYHLRPFPSEHVEESVSADLGSCSISNLSSVDAVSTLSTTFGDEFSTPTRMGSTTRLVPSKKTPISTRCGRCWEKEKFTTALCILSFAGSLGNILRLPRMVYFHGSGVFLLIYVLMTFVFGLPIILLEIGLGQFCQHGAIKLWRAVNLFRGVGYAKTLLTYLLAISYSVQIGSVLSMLVYAAQEFLVMQHENGTLARESDHLRHLALENTLVSWLLRILFLAVVWFLVILCTIRRSVTYRKLMYFMFPAYILMTVTLFANANVVDMTNGLNELFTFNWAALADTEVWYFATVQMFFSLQLGFGSMGTCAGKIIPKANALWVAGGIICSNLILGLAWVILVYIWQSSLPTDSSLPLSPPENFYFSLVNQHLNSGSSFLTVSLSLLLVLIAGMSSLVSLIYTLLVAISIEAKKKWRWKHINSVLSATSWLIACLTLLSGGFSMTHVFEHYVVAHGVIAVTILELVGFAMIYGCRNVYNDLEFVIGRKLNTVWKSLWLITPCVLFVIELCGAFLLPLNSEAGQKSDAIWQMATGWIGYLICWIIVIVCGIYQIWIQVDYNLTQKFLSAMKPSRNWGPVDPIYRHCWVQWRNRYLMTGSRDFTLKRRGTRDYTHHARTCNLTKADNSSFQWPNSIQSTY